MNVVFVGPSLSVELARAELDAVFLGPAAQGDVYRAARNQPQAIGIIDGQFDQLPAVWHKEILWAMSRGIHVYGSASMGALRAAELHTFGMDGVGSIFEWYRDGILEDDDEVAVAHGPASTGYRPTSESMVNIRCTLRAAEEQGIVGSSTGAVLEAVAKTLFYPERSYVAILEGAAGAADAGELAAFAAWWRTGHVDQQRADAVAMLRSMGVRRAETSAPKRVSYTFQETVFWQHLVDTAGAATDEGGVLLAQAILDELWLEPKICVHAHTQALVRHLLLDQGRFDVEADEADLQQRDAEFRSTRNLTDEDALAEWCRVNGLGTADLADLVRAEGRYAGIVQQLSGYRRRVLDQVRLSGAYARLAARAAEKEAALAASGLEARGEVDVAGETEALLAWYLLRCDGDDASDHAFAELTRTNWDEFVRAIVRERLYVEAKRDG